MELNEKNKLEKQIAQAIEETLVVVNKSSVKYAVAKVMNIIEKNKQSETKKCDHSQP